MFKSLKIPVSRFGDSFDLYGKSDVTKTYFWTTADDQNCAGERRSPQAIRADETKLRSRHKGGAHRYLKKPQQGEWKQS
ncbi:hypothetical protein AV530_006391 [Patagioenas fasciata monilis]|uniref:Uncharacterized protein n=1 Tax=Patagioenas fasciata monilis TaxID=372326 RepID=A0A1V4KGE9_PATFA|nr:hypothetical protein AV530_006391 [Patagioenas fasciata monilis]